MLPVEQLLRVYQTCLKKKKRTKKKKVYVRRIAVQLVCSFCGKEYEGEPNKNGKGVDLCSDECRYLNKQKKKKERVQRLREEDV